MLIESKIKIGPDSMFNIHQANFKSAHLLDKIALVQFQRNRTVDVVLAVFVTKEYAYVSRIANKIIYFISYASKNITCTINI